MKKSELRKIIKEEIQKLIEEESYQEKFQLLLKKYGISSPKELKGDKIKKFWDEADSMHDAKKETD